MRVHELIGRLKQCPADAIVRSEDGDPIRRLEVHPPHAFTTVLLSRTGEWDEDAEPPSHVVLS